MNWNVISLLVHSCIFYCLGLMLKLFCRQIWSLPDFILNISWTVVPWLSYFSRWYTGNRKVKNLNTVRLNTNIVDVFLSHRILESYYGPSTDEEDYLGSMWTSFKIHLVFVLRKLSKNTIFYDIESISFATYPPYLIMT